MKLNPDKAKEPFLKRQNWFLAAGLTFVIYVLLVIFLWRFGSEDTAWMLRIVHVILVLVAMMAGLGLLDLRRREDEDRDRRQKRYQARMYLDKIEKEKQSPAQKTKTQLK